MPADLISAITSRLDFAALLDQQGRMLKVETALPALALIPERMVLQDSVSQPFELTLDCLSTSALFELKALIGEQISLRLLQADGTYKPWHGYVLAAAQLGADGGLARYRLTMRPWLAFLGHRIDSFVYQDKTALAIIEEVFKDHPQANFSIQVNQTLRTRSLCTQFCESDLAFVDRLLSEEGLSYRFEHLDGKAATDADAKGHARHVMVIFDAGAELPDLGEVRFTSQHVSANLDGQRDAVTAFMVSRHVAANAVARGSWNYKHVAGTAASDASSLDLGDLPSLEDYDGSGAYRYENSAHAERAAALALAALELQVKRVDGRGSARHFGAGHTFSLIDHPLFGANTTAFNYAGALFASHARPDNQFTLVSVEHHATNNLGAQMAELLGLTDLESGTYRNTFHAVPAAAPLVPAFVRKPTAPQSQTALVVGLAGEPITTDRDLRVKVQFAWQRGERPNAGGLSHESPVDAAGNAPGTEAAGTWVRVAQPAAGANWGSVFTPRIGTEVAMGFLDADIDRPIILGQLYNGVDTPPFSAGVDSGVNHPGVISGLHTQSLDQSSFNQWVVDDASGQLRMRLLTGYTNAEVGLGHLIQQSASSAQRGSWRGSGFEATTQGWVAVHAAQGLLVSATARAGTYGSAESTQMDAAEAISQLKGAADLGARLGAAAQAAGGQSLGSFEAGQSVETWIAQVDSSQDGKHAGAVNGQPALKGQGRELGDPVEAFAGPVVLMETPSAAVLATEAGIAAFAGQDLSITSQSDVHHTAAHTWTSVTGKTTSWYVHSGGIKAIAANGPVSLRAHTDALQIWADQDVTVISVNDEITISASTKIALIAGQSSVTLDGGDIEFKTPGAFAAKGGGHAFLGGGFGTVEMAELPHELVRPVPMPYSLRWKVVGAVDGKPSSKVDVVAGKSSEKTATLVQQSGGDGRSPRDRNETEPMDYRALVGDGSWVVDAHEGDEPVPLDGLDWCDETALDNPTHME